METCGLNNLPYMDNVQSLLAWSAMFLTNLTKQGLLLTLLSLASFNVMMCWYMVGKSLSKNQHADKIKNKKVECENSDDVCMYDIVLPV
jgi:hypothetical protein